MRDAVDGLVIFLRGQVIEQQDRRLALGEKMLQRQDLAAITQRPLREQPDLRKAVQYDPIGFDGIEGLENAPRGFAEFQVR